jgi:hypothetical protein
MPHGMQCVVLEAFKRPHTSAQLAAGHGVNLNESIVPCYTPECLAGLVPPATAVHIMGKGGAVLVLIMLFMAVTSTGSAEQIAVSSLFSYDIYREYFNREATGKEVRSFLEYTFKCDAINIGHRQHRMGA